MNEPNLRVKSPPDAKQNHRAQTKHVKTGNTENKHQKN